ncbi:MFS transporter [Szabonella alba]|uniref:MFS transporter n=1 Tax=Szabonella alba TaxID=2804194 RepID=A0A8K0VCD7_9RHOB|nr:MFS transporter [Szabonella alba]MBL4916692.1 MFS transporter [Szabonella alba]
MPIFTFLRTNAKFLFAGFLISWLSSFGQTYFISVFAGEIRFEFGLSHGGWGAIYGVATTASAVVMLWSGVLTDKFRVRVLAAAVITGLVLACVLMSVSSAIWALVLTIFLLRLLGQGMMSHISGVAMARWFVANRGRALAIAALGFSMGEVSLPLSFVAAKALADWRTLWLVAAGILLICLPVILTLLRAERTPQSMAAESQSTGMEGRHWTRAEVLRHPLFWFLIPALLGPAAFNTAFFFQQVHLAEVKGWPHVALVAIFPVYSAATVVAMLGSGWLVDRVGAVRLMAFYQLPLVAFFLLMGQADNLAQAAPLMVFMGLTAGAQATVPTAFWAEVYGTRHIGSIKAVGASVMVLGSALGPLLTGGLIDAGLDYPRQMTGIAVYFALACLLVWTGLRHSRV